MGDRHRARQQRLFDELPADVTSVVVPPGKSLFYLTGVSMHVSERPALFVLQRDGATAVLLPRLELDRVEDVMGEDVRFFTYADAPDPVAAADGALDELTDEVPLSTPVGVEFRAARLLDLDLLANRVSFEELYDAEDAVAACRARKDDAELETMREAARMTDEILANAIEAVEPGMREIDVERDLRKRVLDSEAEEFGIGTVTAGDRTARAHANTGEYEIQDGDPLMIDVGVVHDGYYSDITRTFSIGEPDEAFREIYDLVRRAARAGREAMAEGVAYQAADRAARSVIEDASYGEYFTHRLGHGLGLEGHEPPYLVEGNEDTFEVGNVVTVEPGVYVPDLGGVRVEDDVVLTEDGPESLTQFPRDLRVI
jgi:Xaa-Pro dipeptidase